MIISSSNNINEITKEERLNQLSSFNGKSIKEMRVDQVKKFEEVGQEIKKSVANLGKAIQARLKEPLVSCSTPEPQVTPYSIVRGIVRKKGKNIPKVPITIAAAAKRSRTHNVEKKIITINSLVQEYAKKLSNLLKKGEITKEKFEILKQRLKDRLMDSFDFKQAKLDEKVVNWRASFWHGALKWRPLDKRVPIANDLDNFSQKIDKIFNVHLGKK